MFHRPGLKFKNVPQDLMRILINAEIERLRKFSEPKKSCYNQASGVSSKHQVPTSLKIPQISAIFQLFLSLIFVSVLVFCGESLFAAKSIEIVSSKSSDEVLKNEVVIEVRKLRNLLNKSVFAEGALHIEAGKFLSFHEESS